MTSTKNQSTAFHGSLDSNFSKHIDRWQNGLGALTNERHIVEQTRTVNYRFHAHFHPYVSQLAKRLIEKSVSGLQAADTEYVQDSDGTFQTLPFSFQVDLPVGLALKLPKPGQSTEFEAITLPGSITVTLPNDVEIKVTGGKVARLPGNVIAQGAKRGARVLCADGTHADLDIGATVTLLSVTRVTLPEAVIIIGADGQQRRLTEPNLVDVPLGTRITLLCGQALPKLYRDYFKDQYAPTDLVQQPYPVLDLDFSSSGAYSVYNWELFYHIPLAVAIHLSKNQRYEEAQHWFHFIFDPTDTSDGPTPERFWKVKPFQHTEAQQIADIMANLAPSADSMLKQDTINSISAWKDAPFRPHLIARYRQSAHMLKAVMAYLDNLVAWGDDLFRQDSGESINEATQIYVLAALILGERPQSVPKKGVLAPLTYASRRNQWDEFGNTLEKMESEIMFDLAPFPISGGAGDQLAILRSIGTSLYFCVPRNDKLMSYWDTVADRLFKIRNSLNLQGIFRQLPLFEPPIDPALLARAAAAGLNIASVVAGVNQPLPLVRFQLLVQKAIEICQEVKALGSNLLAALEKEDNEALSILRAKHEKVILGLAETVKYAQWQETIKNREGLETSLSNAAQRYVYFERMLGKKEDEIVIPELDALVAEGLSKFKFKSSEPDITPREVGVDIAQDLSDSGGKIMSSYETQEIKKLKEARLQQDIAGAFDKLGGYMSMLPGFSANMEPMGVGASISFGGSNLAAQMSFMSSFIKSSAETLSYEANNTAKIGSYSRREQDWAFQSATVAGEINQMYKQLRAAQIRECIAEREWHNHQKQMQHSQEIEGFLTNETSGKKTNQAFYTWMKREVRGMYGQVFQFAYEVAKKAERALQHELGKPDLTFLQLGYMSGKEGLLAGEKLYFDLKRMDLAYHELNQREYELTKHVSLLQVSPMALLQLRRTGQCSITLPEELFDMDGPGHYFRRIKTVALSIPCVTGPYTSVNCTLTLTKSAIRKDALVDDVYARVGTEDSRFSDHYGSLQAIVTSSAQNDSGLFETNLRDERYLPFENSGVVSEWQLQLPSNPSEGTQSQFDYDTISDVILHLRYTAREGGNLLRKRAIEHNKDLVKAAQAIGSVRLFSLRHEFPSEWAHFLSQTAGANQRFELNINLRPEHYPFWSKGQLNGVTRVDILARSNQETAPGSIDIANTLVKNDAMEKKDTLVKDTALGNLLVGKFTNIGLPAKPDASLQFYIDSKELSDFWIIVTWNV